MPSAVSATAHEARLSTVAVAAAARPVTEGPVTKSVTKPANQNGESELDALGQRTVDDQVRAGDEAGARARQEHDRVGDLLGRAHPAGRVARQHRCEHLRVALFDDVPDAALEIHIPG